MSSLSKASSDLKEWGAMSINICLQIASFVGSCLWEIYIKNLKKTNDTGFYTSFQYLLVDIIYKEKNAEENLLIFFMYIVNLLWKKFITGSNPGRNCTKFFMA